MWTLIAALALAQTPDPAAVQADLARWETHLQSYGQYPFAWSEAEVKRLAKGELVKRRTRMDGADRVLGAVWAPVPPDEVWVALQDEEHWGHVEGLYDEKLSGTTFQHKVLFQRIDLPWPFKDRQWVITVVNNLELIEATDNQAWERTWTLSDRRDSTLAIDEGVWVPVNEGGWFVAPVAGGSVLVYHVRAVIGGAVPDEAATQWTLATLGGMMRGLVERSEQSRSHYDAGHSPIRRPDGSTIPPFEG